MPYWIERIVEPRKLFLAWQGPDHLGDRFRWAVAELVPLGADLELCYLGSGTRFEDCNQGRKYHQAVALGYQGYPGYRRDQTHKGVLTSFLRRLPPRSRRDFNEYKMQFRIPPTLAVSDIALLALTEAKLPSDGFSVVDPLNPDAEACDLVVEIAGFRYYVKDQPLHASQGYPVRLLPEPDNQHDRNAVKVCLADRKIGNINRLQAPTFLRWLATRSVSAWIERLNGKSARPRAFIFIRVRSLGLP